jgi:ABC-2 type transport system ATP-binding protein
MLPNRGRDRPQQDLDLDTCETALAPHHLEEVDALADRLAILEAGRVIAEGTPAELKAALGGDRVTLRVRVFQSGEWRDRVALRALDEQVDGALGALGLNPVQRAKLNVQAEAPKGRLAELRAARAAAQA